MFKAFGNHTESEHLDADDGLIAIGAVAHDTRQSGRLGKPAAVVFAVDLDHEDHGRTVPPRRPAGATSPVTAAPALR